MKRVSLVFTLFFATSAFAQDVAEFAALLKRDLRAEKKELLIKGMLTFSDEEAKLFWPVYDAYHAELEKFVDARVALLKSYDHDIDNMTDAKAQTLLTRRFSIDKRRTALDEKYRKRFRGTLSPRRLVRFWQVEKEIQLMIQLTVIAAVPKMKWW